MHATFYTATAAALVQAESARCVADRCITAVPSTQQDLEPLLAELRGLKPELQDIRNVKIPDDLQRPLTSVIEGCADICKRVGDILDGCRDDTAPETCWGLVGASAEIQQLQLVLDHVRRTIQMVAAALKLDDNPRVSVDVAHLRRDTVSGTSTLRSSIVECLNAVDAHVARSRTWLRPDEPMSPMSPMSPTRPSSIQDMILALRRSSTHSTASEDAATCATDEPDDQVGSDTTRHSTNEPMESPDTYFKLNNRNLHRPALDRNTLKPAPLQLDLMSKPQVETQAARRSSLYPPTSPPPDKALPPIPPCKSPLRPRPTVRPASVPRAGALSANANSYTRAKERDRAYSELTAGSTFAPLSPPPSATDRSSAPPKIASRPPRSSSFAYQAPLLSPRPETTYQEPMRSPRPETILTQQSSTDIDIIPLRRLESDDNEGSHGGVYAIETPSQATILASRHGGVHIKIWDLASGTPSATIKVPFYVQVQPRSREYFIRSHAILSTTHALVGIAAGFGQTLEIWNWAKRRKVQTLPHALRWTAVRSDVYESRGCPPLATYAEDADAITLYAAAPAKKPFVTARVIELAKAGLPHLPKLPELAFSATGPLLVAAAGPRPPRPGNPPPAHSGLLMAWELDGDPRLHTPYKFLHTTDHPELANSLPLALETYGSVAVSIWEAAKVRTFGKEGMWQVEPVVVTERVVLVWDFSGAVDRTSSYRIPAVLACVSPDCRYVAYCDAGGGRAGPGALVVLDATRDGQELWRLDGARRGSDASVEALGNLSVRPTSLWSRKSSSEARRRSAQRLSARVSEEGSVRLAVGGGGLDMLAADLKKVTELAFSGDGTRLFVGDSDGGIGVYEFRVDGLHVTMSGDAEFGYPIS